MKTFLKIACALLLSLSLANCGSSGGGGGSKSNDNGITAGANQIDFNNGSTTVTWSSSADNFYLTYSNGARKCLPVRDADDTTPNDVYLQLVTYLSSADINKGENDRVGTNPLYLSIRYSDGTQRTFNLNTASASTSEDTLSNAQEIIDYLDDVRNDIHSSNSGDCTTKKK